MPSSAEMGFGSLVAVGIEVLCCCSPGVWAASACVEDTDVECVESAVAAHAGDDAAVAVAVKMMFGVVLSVWTPVTCGGGD